eukprot:CAMPEP_0168410478 /NCGR_PEP_ID=MMETSP0228-20121227/27714_1 /TAXON_ID=133427 /ORGANISM="Protoceratium reticulatum, Strain CCCM 535 (=CCMP 1889)" /LENGTH=162 /DNA_ID=CAMNT_0008424211 /DNA_START=152 /DNA_END=637 /DNA_ORIENTATION=-
MNGPPEWAGGNTYSKENPYGFDVFMLANVIVELMTGMPMVDIVYSVRNKIFQMGSSILSRTTWCRARGYGASSSKCQIKHAMALFYQATRSVPLTADLMIKYVEWAKTGASKVWNGLMESNDVDREFREFLELLAKMFSISPKDRPTFNAIHQSNIIQKLAW